MVKVGRNLVRDNFLGDQHGFILRFPGDFVFALTRAERDEVVANCDHLQWLKFSPTMPFAFTEHGALMAASVLNTPRAVEVSLYVVRAFVELREVLASNKELANLRGYALSEGAEIIGAAALTGKGYFCQTCLILNDPALD